MRPSRILRELKRPTALQFWSAAPTPLTRGREVDVASLERMIEAAVSDGMNGLFLAGTCGEGPWLPNRERHRLVKAAVAAAHGRLAIAAQVSDNSVPRVLDNIREMADAGAELAVISHPGLMMNATPERITAFFEEAVQTSALPVGIYDWGERRPFCIPEDRLKSIYLLPNVHLVKDSSDSPGRCEIALAARREKPTLCLLNGNEFRCVDYAVAGYDGCMFGGAVAVESFMREIGRLFQSGQLEEMRATEEQMKTVLYGIYGGESIACWLTGLKYFMVQKGIFASTASYLEYPLTEECRMFIERHVSEAGLIGTAS